MQSKELIVIQDYTPAICSQNGGEWLPLDVTLSGVTRVGLRANRAVADQTHNVQIFSLPVSLCSTRLITEMLLLGILLNIFIRGKITYIFAVSHSSYTLVYSDLTISFLASGFYRQSWHIYSSNLSIWWFQFVIRLINTITTFYIMVKMRVFSELWMQAWLLICSAMNTCITPINWSSRLHKLLLNHFMTTLIFSEKRDCRNHLETTWM